MLDTGFPRAYAENDFSRARRHQVMATLAHRLRHDPADINHLISLDAVIGTLGSRAQRRLGLQTIALDTIVGTVAGFVLGVLFTENIEAIRQGLHRLPGNLPCEMR